MLSREEDIKTAFAVCDEMAKVDANRAAIIRHAVMIRIHKAGIMHLGDFAKHLEALLSDEAFVRFATHALSGANVEF